MPNKLSTITIQMGALPAAVKWPPQKLADAIAARLSLVTAASFALFVTGSTAPSSDVGPWLRNGTEWYVWDTGTGAYVPITLASESLGYWIGSGQPDPLVYNFWIETTVGGSPTALKIYYNGAWVDVYATTLGAYHTIAAFNAAIANYSTTAQMTAAIAAAVAAIPSSAAGSSIFKAIPSGNQDIVHAAPGTITTDVAFGTISFDPDSDFGASIFTAPANGYYEFEGSLQVSVPVVGAATQVAGVPRFISSAGGNPAYFGSGPDTEEGTAQRFYAGSTKFYLLTGQTVKVTIDTTVDAACTVRIGGLSFFSGERCR